MSYLSNGSKETLLKATPSNQSILLQSTSQVLTDEALGIITDEVIQFIRPEKDKKSINIEQARSLRRKMAASGSATGPSVYVVLEFQDVSEEVQNTLLKTIEEPSSNNRIILAASDSSSILSTIKSRCLCLNLQPLESDELIQEIVKQTNLNAKEALQLYRSSGSNLDVTLGSAGDPVVLQKHKELIGDAKAFIVGDSKARAPIVKSNLDIGSLEIFIEALITVYSSIITKDQVQEKLESLLKISDYQKKNVSNKTIANLLTLV